MPAADPPARQQRQAEPGERPSFFDTVTRRNSIRGILLFIVLVAFLPTLGLSAWQGVLRLGRDAEAQNRQLMNAAAMISHSEASVITDSAGILAVLAAVPAVRSGDQARCGPVLAEVIRRLPGYSHVAVSGPDGRTACASDARGLGAAFDDRALWRRLPGGRFLVTPTVWDQASGRPVLRAILPLTTPAGAFDGAIIASIDLVWLRRALVAHDDGNGIAVAIVDGAGRPVARSRSLPWDRLVMPAPANTGGRIPVLTAGDADGRRWSYAVAPLHFGAGAGESFSIVYAAAQPARFTADRWFAAGYFVLPLLALVLAASAIWFGANHAILRWVSHLGGLARQIGASPEAAPPDRSHFANAPSEVRDLAAELLRVGNIITDREQRLRRSVAARTEVARELHHRVRNNLQVMASFLSLQAEGVPPGPARQALAEAELRVATMAMVNGLLYADAEVATVSLASLLDPLADLLSRHSGIEAEVRIDPQLVPQPVDIDRAMPLSLWIVEAAVCLFERVDPEHKPQRFSVAITSETDLMCIVVAARGHLAAPPHHSLHRRLVTAIAHQLGGRARIDAIASAGGSAGGSAGARVVLCLPHGEMRSGADCASVPLPTGIAA